MVYRGLTNWVDLYLHAKIWLFGISFVLLSTKIILDIKYTESLADPVKCDHPNESY